MPPVSVPPSPDAINNALHDAAPSRAADTSKLTVSVSFVLHHAENNEPAAYALVRGKQTALAGAEIGVSGWCVVLLSNDSPIGRAVCAAPIGLGDTVTILLPSEKNGETAQIVSWNGCPLLTETEREVARQIQTRRETHAQNAQAAQRKADAERGKQNGVIAELRARRIEKEAAWRTPKKPRKP